MKMRCVVLWCSVVTLAAADGWWDSAVIYQIYPRSFMDSNGDGIGDLNGIKSKLGYLKETGVDAIWLSPIYKSPMYDFGYDIIDYKSIDPDYGTMDDFDALMKEAKNQSIRVILDYVPNHTSNESDWFVRSKNNETEYIDYYIWANGRPNDSYPEKGLPPNNWVSLFRKSAWEYSPERKQWYLHQFVIGQPDLNYRSSKVREAMKDVLKFWLDKGVSGFRVDAINMMYEVDASNFGGVYPDEPLAVDAANYGPDDYNYLNHIYTKDLAETYQVVYDWREVLDTYKDESKIMMTEGYTELTKMMTYYGDGTRNGSIPFNFIFLGEINDKSTAVQIKQVIDKWMAFMPPGKVANWVNGNHDQSRMATRYGVDRVDIMNLLALILPGVTITYQGEELGMTDGHMTWEETQDPQACNTDDPVNYEKSSRDPERTPFHWDNTTNAGFSTAAKTWLPVASNYKEVNVAVQKAASKSHYKFYKDVVALKHTAAVSSSNLQTVALSDSVLVVNRAVATNQSVIGIVNLADTAQVADISSISLVAETLKIVATGVSCAQEKGATVSRTNISLAAHCALALEPTVTPTTTSSTTTTTSTTTKAPATGNNTSGNGTNTNHGDMNIASLTVYLPVLIAFFLYNM